MGRHVAGEMPELDRLVVGTCAEIGRELDVLCIPRLAGVVLGGGYGRGEGGAIGEKLSNDLDFFAITESGASSADIAAIAAALEPVSKKWTERLGIDVDFTVRTPWRIRHDQKRLMIQELLHGYVDVAGEKGEELFSGVERREPSQLPWSEAERLLLNRGMGLLFAKEDGRSADFTARNINKCILGAGDARLIAKGAYLWRAIDRSAALGDPLYATAVEWKFRPKSEPVCDWERAREVWLSAYDEFSRLPRRSRQSRNIFNALRWIARRRTLGELATLGLPPETRVLRRVHAAIRDRRPIAPSLLRDWQVFN